MPEQPIDMASVKSQLGNKQWTKDSYRISTDASLLPIKKLCAIFESDDFYWAKAMPEASMKETLENSLCFGVYSTAPVADLSEGEESADGFVGFARCVTDFTTFIYLTDVWVDAKLRGQGIGTWLIQCVQGVIESMPHLRRSLLFTTDWERSVPFYEKHMGMQVLEARQGKGIAVMGKMGQGHSGFMAEKDTEWPGQGTQD